jgi:hypothetical protein
VFPAAVRILLSAAVVLGWSARASAQTPAAMASASATAGANALIVEPVGILAAANGTSASMAQGAGVAEISGGKFNLMGQANQVVSVTTNLPTSVQRVGGGGALRVTAAPSTTSPTLDPAGAAAFDVAGAAPVQDAASGLYTGSAEVLVNLN